MTGIHIQASDHSITKQCQTILTHRLSCIYAVGIKDNFLQIVAQLIKSVIDAEVQGIKISQKASFTLRLPNDFYLKVYYRVVIQWFLL